MYCDTDADLDIDVVVSQLKLAGTLYCGLYYLMYLLWLWHVLSTCILELVAVKKMNSLSMETN